MKPEPIFLTGEPARATLKAFKAEAPKVSPEKVEPNGAEGCQPNTDKAEDKAPT